MNRSTEVRGPHHGPASDEPMHEAEVADTGRTLINELIQTGVPAAAVQDTGKQGSGWLATLYIVIPLLALSLLFGLAETTGSNRNADDRGRQRTGATRSSNEGIDLTARSMAFDTDSLNLNAGARTVIHFENREASSIQHNVAIYKNSGAQDPIFRGKIIAGGADIDYEFTAPSSGEYFFRCDVHPSMNGTVVVTS